MPLLSGEEGDPSEMLTDSAARRRVESGEVRASGQAEAKDVARQGALRARRHLAESERFQQGQVPQYRALSREIERLLRGEERGVEEGGEGGGWVEGGDRGRERGSWGD